MNKSDTNVDSLLKARSQIDDELRRLKASLTILFTDVVGSTSYFDRYGDTAGVAMLSRHTDDVRGVVRRFEGRVVKTIGDSVMAEFPTARAGVEAAAEVQLHQLEANLKSPAHEQIQIRIGVNSGLGYRKDDDIYGDVVNLAARLTKRSSPAQVLVSKTVMKAAGQIEGVGYTHLGKVTVEGRSEKDDLYEVVWTDPATYDEIRRKTSTALVRGEIYPRSSHTLHSQHATSSFPTPPVSGPERLFETPPPAPTEMTRRYDLLEELGRGGMGIVYKARDRETGDLIALKLLKPEIASDKTVMARFKNELRLARKITHKNVCRIYEFNRAGTTAFISMEFVEGESLRAALSRYGSVSVRKALEMGRQICNGLGEAHSQGVIHRDLKPENVMVDGEGRAKIMDFGIARSVTATLTQTGSTLGTPSYMAPEQAEGKPVDERTDIYAVGLLLFEVLTGRQVFTGDTAAQVAYKQVYEPPPALRTVDPTLPPAFEDIISHCLCKNPEDRFRTVESVEGALASLADSFETPAAANAPIAAPIAMPVAAHRERRRVPRRVKIAVPRLAFSRALSVVGVIVAVLLAVAAGWTLIGSGVAEPPVVNAETPAPSEELTADAASVDRTDTPDTPGTTEPALPGSSSTESARASATVGTTPAKKVTTPAISAPTQARTSPAVQQTPDPQPDKRDGSDDSDVFPVITSSGSSDVEDAQGQGAPAVSESVAGTDAEAAASDGELTIAVQSFTRKGDAAALRDQLVEGGFPAHVLTTDGTAHRVWVGPFSNIEVARAAQRRLRVLGYTAVLAANNDD